MKATFLTTLFFAFVCHLSMAQGIHGVVRDSLTNDPLPFTNVSVQGQNAGTIANADGIFILDSAVTAGAEFLLFSHVGYETYRLSTEDITSPVNIHLRPAAINLQEVLVSSEQLSARDIIDLVVANFDQNHPSLDQEREIFFHHYSEIVMPPTNDISVLTSDFQQMDQGQIE